VFTSLCRWQNGSRSYWGLLYHISSPEGSTIACQKGHSGCADLPTALSSEHKREAKIYQGFADDFREGNMPLMVKPARWPDLTLSLASPHHTPVLFNPGLRREEPAWLLLHESARAFGLENRRMRPVGRWLSAIIAAYCACALAAFRAPPPRLGRESPVPSSSTFRTLRGGGCPDPGQSGSAHGCRRRCRWSSARPTQSCSSGFPRAKAKYLRQRSRAWGISYRS
jgi:hypothetical protein